MACDRWKIESKYAGIDSKAIELDFNYCPFCGSELDEDGCTQGELTIQVFGTLKDRFDKLEVNKPTVVYKNKKQLEKFKELMGDNVNYKKSK